MGRVKWFFLKTHDARGLLMNSNRLTGRVIPPKPKVESPEGLLRAARAEAKRARKRRVAVERRSGKN